MRKAIRFIYPLLPIFSVANAGEMLVRIGISLLRLLGGAGPDVAPAPAWPRYLEEIPLLPQHL